MTPRRIDVSRQGTLGTWRVPRADKFTHLPSQSRQPDNSGCDGGYPTSREGETRKNDETPVFDEFDGRHRDGRRSRGPGDGGASQTSSDVGETDMSNRHRRHILALAVLLTITAATLPAMAGNSEREVRFATFNASLNRAAQGELITDLSTTTDIQAQAVAEIIQRTRPDVLLINEFDFDDDDVALDLFQDNYLSMAQNYDDEGNTGGLEPGSLFVIAGDQNSDPFDGDSVPGSAQLLLEHPRINAKTTPTSEGGVDRSAAQPGNESHLGDPAQDTADFSEPPFGPGNLRADYVLPVKSLRIGDSGIFWPADDDPLNRLTGTGVFGDPVPSSDHRLVWVDVSHGGFPKG